jgi:hypothetical protein
MADKLYILKHLKILSRIGCCVTNNNGFRIRLSDESL